MIELVLAEPELCSSADALELDLAEANKSEDLAVAELLSTRLAEDAGSLCDDTRLIVPLLSLAEEAADCADILLVLKDRLALD